ncbi:hypothetical protein [Bacillus glycinifermentans]|nr:hypothetical protein [Bacillus glycinifermentans]
MSKIKVDIELEPKNEGKEAPVIVTKPTKSTSVKKNKRLTR